jgi:hypothetical protein
MGQAVDKSTANLRCPNESKALINHFFENFTFEDFTRSLLLDEQALGLAPVIEDWEDAYTRYLGQPNRQDQFPLRYHPDSGRKGD